MRVCALCTMGVAAGHARVRTVHYKLWVCTLGYMRLLEQLLGAATFANVNVSQIDVVAEKVAGSTHTCMYAHAHCALGIGCSRPRAWAWICMFIYI